MRAEISDDARLGVCPACLLETALRLLDDEDEDPIGHPRPPQSEVDWDSLRGDPRFEKIVAALAPK